MANYQNLKAAISAAIRTNGNQEITGQVLQDVLNSIVSVIGANYTFAGVATPATNPGTPDQNVMYLAMEGGTYTNFSGMVLPAGISLLMWNGTWTSETVMCGDGGVFDISVYKSSGGTLATFADLAAALDGGNNIPASARKGGMSVKFVQSFDNNYVQYRLVADEWSADVKDWAVFPNVFEIENPEFFQVFLDKEKRVIESTDKNGKKTFYFDVFVKGKINDNDIRYENNVEYTAIIKDKNGKVFLAFRGNGEPEFGIKYPKFVIDTIINYLGDYQKFPIDFGMPKVFNSWLVVGDGCEGGMKPYCVVVGKNAMKNNTGIKNMTVGQDNMKDCSGHDNTSMGYHASFRNTSGSNNAAFGSESQDDNTSGSLNSSIGFCSLQRNNEGDENVAVGAFALAGGLDEHYDAENPKEQNYNVAVGAYAMKNAQSGSTSNVAIGRNAMPIAKVYTNNIAIGEEADCDKDNQTVIGNDSTVETIVRGDLIVKGTDGIKRQIVFNQDGTCSWTQVN